MGLSSINYTKKVDVIRAKSWIVLHPEIVCTNRLETY